MRLFIIPEGKKVFVTKSGGIMVEIEEIVTTKESVYEVENIVADPLAITDRVKFSNTVAGGFARKGYYGFNLIPNLQKEVTIYAHINDVNII